jgi:hypothetical protein
MQCICKKEIDTNGEFNFDINKIYDFEIVNNQYLISDGNDNYRLTMNHDDFLDNFIFVLQQKPEDAYTTASAFTKIISYGCKDSLHYPPDGIIIDEDQCYLHLCPSCNNQSFVYDDDVKF